MIHHPSERLEYSLSFILICCKVLVLFSFSFSFLRGFVDTCARQRILPVSVTYIRQGGILLLSPLASPLLRDFVMPVASLVTYIHQCGILLLSPLAYPLSRDFVMPVASLVTYIHQNGILLLGLYPFKGFC